MTDQPRLRLVVLISGSGSNLQAIIDACTGQHIHADIAAVISNRPDAYGLTRAQQAGIPSVVLDHKAFANRESYESRLQTTIDAFRPGLVVLAGYMRILQPDTVEHYLGRMINIHPSLLPEFQGLNTHQRALDAGHTKHGASVHYVTPELDGGPVILQSSVPVKPGDDASSLASRVLAQEHLIYPQVIDWIAQGRVSMDKQHALFNGTPLKRPLHFPATDITTSSETN